MIKDIQQARIEAMRQKERDKSTTLAGVISDLKNKAIERRIDAEQLDSAEIIAILQKMVIQRQESAQMYQKANRHDLAEKEMAEVEIISAFLPKQLTDEETDALVDHAIQETNASSIKDMKNVMAYVKEKSEGRVNMKTIGGRIKNKLS